MCVATYMYSKYKILCYTILWYSNISTLVVTYIMYNLLSLVGIDDAIQSKAT